MKPHERLDVALERRCDQLDMTWTELAAVSGVSEVTLRALRRGDNKPSARTKRRLEDALQWERGSIQAILEGGEAIPLADQPDGRRRESTDEIVAENRAGLAEISAVLEEALAARRGKPLTETQRRVTADFAKTFERTIEALDPEGKEEAG